MPETAGTEHSEKFSVTLDPVTAAMIRARQATLPYPNSFSAAIRDLLRELAALKANQSKQPRKAEA